MGLRLGPALRRLCLVASHNPVSDTSDISLARKEWRLLYLPQRASHTLEVMPLLHVVQRESSSVFKCILRYAGSWKCALSCGFWRDTSQRCCAKPACRVQFAIGTGGYSWREEASFPRSTRRCWFWLNWSASALDVWWPEAVKKFMTANVRRMFPSYGI